VEEFHVLVELNAPVSLNYVSNLKGITRFEQDWRAVNKATIQFRVDSNHVLVNLWLYLVGYIVINRIAHVLREHILEALLIERIVIEHFYENIE
jgi:hypothetical protein